MQFQTNIKNRLAYLGALTLLFSYIELILPRFIPFFRLGLANIVILQAFDLPFPYFFLLTSIKAFVSSLVSGTLFSPFFLISLVQSVISGIFMYLLTKIFRNRIISVYSISVFGSELSAFVQIFMASFYLGTGPWKLLGPMMIFGVISGIITAFLSLFFRISDSAPLLAEKTPEASQFRTTTASFWLKSLLLIGAVIITLSVSYLPVSLALLIIALISQKLCHRKFMLLPHLSLWIFVIVSTLITPEGKVIFTILGWNITDSALFSGIIKACKLSAVAAFSQCAAVINFPGNNLISLTLSYSKALNLLFQNSKGNLISRLKNTLSLKDF